MRCVSLINVYLVQTHHKCEWLKSQNGGNSSNSTTNATTTDIATTNNNNSNNKYCTTKTIHLKMYRQKLNQHRNSQSNVDCLLNLKAHVHKLIANYHFTVALKPTPCYYRIGDWLKRCDRMRTWITVEFSHFGVFFFHMYRVYCAKYLHFVFNFAVVNQKWINNNVMLWLCTSHIETASIQQPDATWCHWVYGN